MAARKLAAEIDRTVKKIAEGVQEFETIYDKLQSAQTPSQSAKYESELKTSIKRLQRMRDQVKVWLQSNDIKDKTVLMDNRKLVESQMEKFKASEKELKTKAFSKEGLAASKLDPAEKAKLELTQWLSTQVDELGRQVEMAEAEIEQAMGGGKKKKSGGASERLAQLEHLNDRRKWHSSRLEIVLRMLENGALETERVEEIKEDISYFVESNADEDFEEDDGIYDEFNLDDEEEAFGLKDNDDVLSHDATSQPDDTPTPVKMTSTTGRETKQRRESEDLKVEDKPRKTSMTSTTTARKTSGVDMPSKEAKAIPAANFAQAKAPPANAPVAPSSVTSPPKASAATQLPPIRYAAAAAAAVTPGNSASSPVASTQPIPAGRQGSEAGSTTLASGPSPPIPSSRPVDATAMSNGHAQSPSQPHQASASVTSTPAQTNSQVQQGDITDTLGGHPISPTSAHVGAGPPGLKPNGTSANPYAASRADAANENGEDGNVSNASLGGASAAANIVQGDGGGSADSTTDQAASTQKQHQPASAEARLPSSLADLVSSFESAKQNSMRRDEDLSQVHKSLESSLMNVPESHDSEKPRYYVPQNPYPTPQWYPQSPAALFDNPAVYAKFDEDTLLYIFYYSHRDYHRYLAARELKRQSWRFSIRYGTWFRRHSEPIAINEEYEEGSYVYFDFESSWCQRRKNHFRFEYKYLESELV